MSDEYIWNYFKYVSLKSDVSHVLAIIYESKNKICKGNLEWDLTILPVVQIIMTSSSDLWFIFLFLAIKKIDQRSEVSWRSYIAKKKKSIKDPKKTS